ncbi:hypothetical protein TREES_T100005167 [Tupaia chinensis]|uniref:Uncharacterized protein n=1 Tax=Tupaia chinensis TaxID=246437 RepID=L9L256_TUPCH|nr:hypothetical protein TREES_T100005167 [Tupaia chinensis]
MVGPGSQSHRGKGVRANSSCKASEGPETPTGLQDSTPGHLAIGYGAGRPGPLKQNRIREGWPRCPIAPFSLLVRISDDGLSYTGPTRPPLQASPGAATCGPFGEVPPPYPGLLHIWMLRLHSRRWVTSSYMRDPTPPLGAPGPSCPVP